MPPKPKLNVHAFPRPPLLEKTPRHLLVKWTDGTVIAETREGYWVLETTHPPSEYGRFCGLRGWGVWAVGTGGVVVWMVWGLGGCLKLWMIGGMTACVSVSDYCMRGTRGFF